VTKKTLKALAGGVLPALIVLALVAGRAVAAVGQDQDLGAVGTLHTIAGPGFCQGRTLPSILPLAPLRSLAVDETGHLFVDQKTKLGGVGTIRQFDVDGVTSVNSGIALGEDSADSAAIAAAPPVAGRLAPDGTGGVLIAAGPKVVDIAKGGGSLTTLIGDPAVAAGTASLGDGGPAAAARFKDVRSIATDQAHNLYIADQIDAKQGTFRIRFYNRGDAPVSFYAGTPSAMVVAPGAINTIAGAGTKIASAEPTPTKAAKPDGLQGDGPAREATLQGVPPAMSVVKDALYLGLYWRFPGAPAETEKVRVINLGGQTLVSGGVSLAAGDIATLYQSAQRGALLKNSAGYVPGIAADAQGRIFLADEFHHRIVQVGAGGRLTNVAGTGRPGFNGNGRPALSAQLNHPYDVKIGARAGSRGDLVISDGDNGRARVVGKNGEIRAVFEDPPLWRCAKDSAPASPQTGTVKKASIRPSLKPQTIAEEPKPGSPTSPRTGPGHAIYFVNGATKRAMKLEASGAVVPLRIPGHVSVTALVPRPGGGLYLLDGPGAKVHLFNTTSKAISAHRLRVAPGAVKALAQSRSAGQEKSQGAGLVLGAAPQGAQVSPAGLAVDGRDNLFVTDFSNGRVLSFQADGAVTVLAGKGAASPLDGCCQSPTGIALDSSGNAYVSDLDPGSVWFVNRSARPVRVHAQTIAAKTAVRVVGTGKRGVGGEGVAVENPLAAPAGLALGRGGDLFIAEAGDSAIRRVDLGGHISTLAGTGKGGFNGDGIQGKLTRLNTPTGVAMDECGNLLIADTGNDRIARFNLGGVCANRSGGGSAASGHKQAAGSNTLVLLLVAAAAAGALIGAAFLMKERRSR